MVPSILGRLKLFPTTPPPRLGSGDVAELWVFLREEVSLCTYAELQPPPKHLQLRWAQGSTHTPTATMRDSHAWAELAFW